MPQVRSRAPDENSYKILKKKNNKLITCDFCEKKFKNRFSSIKHNIHHIVIPLIKLPIIQCPQCLFNFQSKEELNIHAERKHGVLLECNIKSEFTNDSILISTIKSNYLTNDENSEVGVEEYILPDICPESDIKTEKSECVDILSNDLGEFRKDEDSSSVHYDVLMLPGIYRCKHCHLKFPNRLKAIEHESSHLTFKRGRPLLCTICDMYIAGNHWQLSKHVAVKHPLRTNRPRTKTVCSICGLKYHKYARHLVNYHPNVLKDTTAKERSIPLNADNITTFAGDLSSFSGNLESCSDVSNINLDLSNSSLFNVCQGCLPFLKKKINLKYIIVGTINQVGVRHKCSKCYKKFFEIIIVRRVKRSVDKLQFEGDAKKCKIITNKERLRNIQLRLKMIKKLSKI